ncbi:hypothetical protein [Thermococcus pacificus]|uniref:hypothetical protein n=1 Tax=Thermococcus pacificus TaxID=71998 RepID=UPI001E465F5C|nr:hypothetical protein [Thermococcus pacificus]
MGNNKILWSIAFTLFLIGSTAFYALALSPPSLSGTGVNVVSSGRGTSQDGGEYVLVYGNGTYGDIDYEVYTWMVRYPPSETDNMDYHLSSWRLKSIITAESYLNMYVEDALMKSKSNSTEFYFFQENHVIILNSTVSKNGQLISSRVENRSIKLNPKFAYIRYAVFNNYVVVVEVFGHWKSLTVDDPHDEFAQIVCYPDEFNRTVCDETFLAEEYDSYESSIDPSKIGVMGKSLGGVLSRNVLNAVLNHIKSSPSPPQVTKVTIIDESGNGVDVKPGYLGNVPFTEEDVKNGVKLTFMFHTFDENANVNSYSFSYSGPGGPASGGAMVFNDIMEFYSFAANSPNRTLAYTYAGWVTNASGGVVVQVYIPPGKLKEGPFCVAVNVNDGDGSATAEVSWTFVPKDSQAGSPGYSVKITAPRNGATLKQIFDGYFTMSLLADVNGSGAKDLYAVVTLPDGSKKREAVMGGTIADIIDVSDPTVKGGTVRVDLYGTVNGTRKLLASDSVRVSFVSKEVPGDNIDNDLDGLVDCDDPDIAACDACIQQKKLEWAESLMNRHISYIQKMMEVSPEMKSVYEIYIDHLHELHDNYKDDPDRMVKEMNDYMEAKVYANQKINSYLSIFKDDPEKRHQLRLIAEEYRYDPIMRDIKMKDFIYRNAQSVAERTAITNAIITGVIEPPQWLVGGQYGSGGAIDWAHFVASNFEKVGDTVKFKGNAKVKMLRTPATVYLVALDAKALMDQARELQKMNLPENTKVSIIVLDGATKIGKLLDPTGYFGNMADATLGAIVNLRKKIEERNQGWFTWNGYVLHETAIPGVYEDYETGKKFRRVDGGWLSSPNFVEVGTNG